MTTYIKIQDFDNGNYNPTIKKFQQPPYLKDIGDFDASNQGD